MTEDSREYRRWCYLFGGLSFGILLLIGVFNFMIDPYQHYRKAQWYKPIYGIPLERFINPGIASNYDYDTAIIGTSMTENFALDDVSRRLGFEAVNLSLSGASLYEQNLILKVALRTQKVKRVLWCLDIFSFNGSSKRFRFGAESMPLYLYDDEIMNDYKYLLNRITFRKSLECLFSRNSANRNGNRPYYWADSVVYSRTKTLEDWSRAMRQKDFNRTTSKDDVSIEVLKTNYFHNLLPNVVLHPNVRFVFFFPPYSILSWKYIDAEKLLENYLQLKEFIIKDLTSRSNVEIYDFQDLELITTNLDNYKDISHYSPDVDHFILDSIARKHYLVTRDSIEERIAGLRAQVENAFY